MILCVRGTSRSSEQSTQITQREQVFFLTVLLNADWLSRQTPITWKGMKIQCNIRAYNLGCKPSYLSPFSRKIAKSKIIFSWSSRRNVVPALTDKSPNYEKFAHKRRRIEVAPLRARYHFPRTSLKRVPRIQNLLIARSTFYVLSTSAECRITSRVRGRLTPSCV